MFFYVFFMFFYVKITPNINKNMLKVYIYAYSVKKLKFERELKKVKFCSKVRK